MVSSISTRTPSPDEIRRRLADTELPRGPEDIIELPGSQHWPRHELEREGKALRPAGVLVPIMQRSAGLSVLLTRRSAELRHHAGQVSFPGGRLEESDADIEAAALRETEEEVGIAISDIAVIGYLGTMRTSTGFAVSPVVGMIPGTAELVVDRTEVDYAFEVPLSFLLDPANEIRSEWERDGHKLPMIEFHWDDERIWGATAFMIRLLREKLLKQ